MEQIRECGECDLCCRFLYHEVYGQHITPGNPCRFIKDGCSIHPNRPPQCKRYQCFWAQGVLPEWMFPKDIGVMVSVKNWPHGKWLEVVNAGKEVTEEILAELLKFKVPLVYINDGYQHIQGPPEFTEFIKDYERQFSNLLPPVSE
jgi:Fe-S-cluster containining protein|tara:strand:- start:244 stop:681 length:438 start_codon:yes stop_codon:yes gene_type:complete